MYFFLVKSRNDLEEIEKQEYMARNPSITASLLRHLKLEKRLLAAFRSVLKTPMRPDELLAAMGY